MRILNSGSVGIRTVAPNATLDVLGTTRLGDSTTNYTAVSGTGALDYAGSARPKRTIVLTAAGAVTPSGGAPQTLNGTNFKFYTVDFADGSTKDAYWQFIVPDSLDATVTTADVTVYWRSTATTNACRWEVAMDGKPVNTADVFDTALTAATPANTAPNGTAGALTTTTFSGVTTGWGDSEVAAVRVSRIGGDAGDTMTAVAELVMVKIEWTASAESD